METSKLHRPLVSGIRIQSAKKAGNSLQFIGGGTLTGLATSNLDGQRVLVTNLHVMTGSVQTNPSGSEEMYQVLVSEDNKVGSFPARDPNNPAWVPILIGQNNIADVAICGLENGVDAEPLSAHP